MVRYDRPEKHEDGRLKELEILRKQLVGKQEEIENLKAKAEKTEKLESDVRALIKKVSNLESSLKTPLIEPSVSSYVPEPKQVEEGIAPIAQMLRPGSYLEYVGDYFKSRYTVLSITGEIINFESRLTDLEDGTSETDNDTYIDRHGMIYRDFKNTGNHSDFWLYPGKLKIGNVIPIFWYTYRVVDTDQLHGRKLYHLKPNTPDPDIYEYWYDEKTGVLYKESKIRKSGNLSEWILSTNLQL